MSKKSRPRAMENSDSSSLLDSLQGSIASVSTEADPIKVATAKWAFITAFIFDCLDRVEHLKQSALARLDMCEREDNETLDAYIRRILTPLWVFEWLGESNAKRQAMLRDTPVDVGAHLKIAAHIRQELSGRRHSNSTELITEDRRR